jgi:hypothetical protein
MKVDYKAVQLSGRRWRFVSKQIDGNYHNWRQTIPNSDDAQNHITLAPAKLEAPIMLIQRMPRHDAKKFQTICLECKGGNCGSSAKTTAMSHAHESLCSMPKSRGQTH